MKIAHISDLHFSKVSLNPFQIFSKRILGNGNLLFNRKYFLDNAFRFRLIEQFHKLGVTHVIISGDFSTTSYKKEFEIARKFVMSLQSRGFKVFVVPGNHDNYTKSAYRNKDFYTYLGSLVDFDSDGDFSYSLDQQGIQIKHLQDRHYLIALDTTLYTSWLYSNGIFSANHATHLDEILSTLPEDAIVTVVNHFPFFQVDGPLKDLANGSHLEELLKKHPKVKLYLHGHTHRHSVVDLRNHNLPIVLDAGCVANSSYSTWNLVNMTDEGCEVEVYACKNAPSWKKDNSYTFAWEGPCH